MPDPLMPPRRRPESAGPADVLDDPTVANILRDLQIIHGNPTPEELAIVAAIVSATGQAGHVLSVKQTPPSRWAEPARRVRQPLPRSGWARSLQR
jgi:hypothetical protein